MVIDGKKIAEGILENLKKSEKPNKFMAVFLIGDDATAVGQFCKTKGKKLRKRLVWIFGLINFPKASVRTACGRRF